MMAASTKCGSRPSPRRETARIRPEGSPPRGARSDRLPLPVITGWENARLAEARRSPLVPEALARQLEEDAAGAATARQDGTCAGPPSPCRARHLTVR